MIKIVQRPSAWLVAAGLLAALPFSARAMTAELVSLTPEATTDITDQLDPGSDTPAGMVMFGWVLTADTEYTAVFTVSEEPAIVITPGATISVDNRYTYDAETGTLTVPFTATGLVEEEENLPEGSAISVLAMMGPVEIGEDGPPAEMTGTWFSTNLEEWNLLPPSDNNNAFGFELTGPAGESGFFQMFMPDAIIDLMSEFAGKDLTAADLAIFNGDAQSSLAITEVEGGAYIDINVVFDDESTAVSAAAGTDTVTKKITAQPQLALSLAAKKTELKSGKLGKLYGWLATGKKNKTVTIWRKRKGENSFTKYKTVTTGADGYFSKSLTLHKTTTFKATSGNKTSDKVTVTVK